MTDPEAIRRVIDGQRHRVYTLAYYTLGSHADAEDATQEVLTRYWRNASKVDPARVEGWLVRVTTNVCHDWRRKRALRRESFATEVAEHALDALPCENPSPSETAESTETVAEVTQTLQGLNEPYRSLLILRDVQGLDYQAIADALEMPLSRVKVYLHRGRKRLGEKLRQANKSSNPTTPTTACPHET